MAYNEELAMRIRATFNSYPKEVQDAVTEKKMFGGITFLFHGKMTVGIIKEVLMVRVVSHKMKLVLAMDAVRPMDFTKRPMKEFIYVDPSGVKTELQLLEWVEMGLEHAKSKLSLKH